MHNGSGMPAVGWAIYGTTCQKNTCAAGHVRPKHWLPQMIAFNIAHMQRRYHAISNRYWVMVNGHALIEHHSSCHISLVTHAYKCGRDDHLWCHSLIRSSNHSKIQDMPRGGNLGFSIQPRDAHKLQLQQTGLAQWLYCSGWNAILQQMKLERVSR